MKVSIYDRGTFDIHVDKKELLLIYHALDSMEHGSDYYFMAKEIADAIQEVQTDQLVN